MMSKRFFVVSLIIIGLILNCFSFYAQGEPTNIINDSIIIDSLQVYRDLGFDISKIDNPILYEKECLVEGNLPFVVKFNNPSVVNVNEKSSLLSSIEKDKLGFGSINYKYMVLLSYEKILKMPVYKKISYNNFDKINKTWNNGSYEIIDFYKDVVDTRYHWVETKDLNLLSIPKNGFIVIDVVGCFKAQLGSRNIDIIPSITINGVTSSFPGYAWWNSNWLYSKKITIDYTKVSADLINFPVLFDNTSASFAHAQADGDDFAFVSNNNVTKYNHEIENFSSNRLIAWVNVTRVSNTENTIVWLYYGNAACSSQQDKNNTWNGNYNEVLHMTDKTTSLVDDSTTNNNDFTKTAANHPISGTGKIFNSQDFERSTSDYGTTTTDVGSVYTIESWVKMETVGTTEQYFHVGAAVVGTAQVGYYDARFRAFQNDRNGAVTTGASSVVVSTWYHLVYVVNGKYHEIYLNGVSKQSKTETYNPTTDTNTKIGIGYTGAYWDGMVDEFRFSNSIRNVSWINASYLNQNSPSIFLSVGAETAYNTPPSIYGEHPTNKSINQPLSFTWNCTIVDIDGDTFNWNIDCSNGQSISMNGASNGNKSLPLTGFNYYTNYTIWVNVTDGIGWTNKSFWFKTISRCPVIGNISENLSIWYCVNLSDDYGSITKYNISLFNGSQYKKYSGVTVGNKTVCVLFSNLSYNTTYIVNISVFDGFCYTNSSDTFNISLGGDLNMMLADMSIEPTQLFLFIVLSLWLFFISHYLNKRRHDTNNFIIGLSIFLLSIPLSINLVFIAMSFVFGYVLVFLIPLLSLVFLVDSIFNKG